MNLHITCISNQSYRIFHSCVYVDSETKLTKKINTRISGGSSKLNKESKLGGDSEPIRLFGNSEPVHSVAWSWNNEQLLISGMAQKYIRIYDLRSSKFFFRLMSMKWIDS